MKKIIGTIISLFFLVSAFAQPVQTIRVRVIDSESKIPLPGVNIILLNSDPLVGATSDAEGIFRIDNVPVGRQSIKVSRVGAKACPKPDSTNRPERKHD